MNLLRLTRQGLIEYTARQLRHFFPDGREVDEQKMATHMGEALQRLAFCIDHIAMWHKGVFDHLHSSQYCLYLYYLANTLWRNTGDSELCTRLFLLNKALNGIDCFYEIDLPPVLFIGHSVGIVLAKAEYGNFLVLYQNSSVGKNHGQAPTIGEGVIMYPNSAIIGRSKVENATVLSPGSRLVNQDSPGNCMVFSNGRYPEFKPLRRPILQDIFRLP